MNNKRRRFLLHLDKALSNSLRRQILILCALLVVMLAVSYLFMSFSGLEWRKFCQSKDLSVWLLPIYLLIDPNALNTLYIEGHVHGWMLFASSITYMLGMFVFNGLIIGVINNAIGYRVEDYRDGFTHYLKSGHHIIMGYDEMVPSIINDIFAKNKDADVLLMTSADVKKIKEKLKKSVAKKQLDHIIVNYGHRIASEYYRDIHLEAAVEVFIAGWRSQASHDAVNVECVDSICKYLKGIPNGQKPKRITCVFEDIDTYAAFKTSEIFDEVRDLGIEFIPYNFYTGWAKQVFVNRSYKEKSCPDKEIHYPAVYGNGIVPDDKRHVHLVFVGTTNFAVAFAMEAAHLLHFPNFEHDNRKRTRITFIEKNADEEMRLFKTRNRHFFDIQEETYHDMSEKDSLYNENDMFKQYDDRHNFLDVEFEFIKGDVYSDNIQELLRKWACDENQCMSVFLAQFDQRKNFIMAMNMPDELYDRNIPIFIRQDRADNFVTNLRDADSTKQVYSHMKYGEVEHVERKGRYANIYPFGMDDMAYCTDERAFKQAKLINYLYSNINNYHFPDLLVLDSMSKQTIFKEADKVWRGLSVAVKWSNLYCAYSLRCKLDSLRAMRGLKIDDDSRDQYPLSQEEIKEIAAVEHNRWNVEKLLMGYRKAKPEEDRYDHTGFSKDDVNGNKKLFIHHDIRPFNKLGDVKQLDFEIAKYIPWILEMTE